MLYNTIIHIKQFYYALMCKIMHNKHMYEWSFKKAKTLKIRIMQAINIICA